MAATLTGRDEARRMSHSFLTSAFALRQAWSLKTLMRVKIPNISSTQPQRLCFVRSGSRPAAKGDGATKFVFFPAEDETPAPRHRPSVASSRVLRLPEQGHNFAAADVGRWTFARQGLRQQRMMMRPHYYYFVSRSATMRSFHASGVKEGICFPGLAF
jgi:hypothetical protein